MQRLLKNNLNIEIWYLVCVLLGIFLTVSLLLKPYRQDNSLSQYQSLISSDHFIHQTYQDLSDTIQNKEDAIYFLGYENCPWCNDVVPVLYETLNELDMTIFHINTEGLKEDKTNYPLMQSLLKDILDESQKIYVPNVIIIKEGKIIDHHLGTIEGHDAHKEELNKEGQQMLKDIYKKMFSEVKLNDR